MRDDKQETSAGCIIFREDELAGTCVLLLQIYTKFDLPKGHVEKKDGSFFNAAARETQEECGFSISSNPEAELSEDSPVARILRGVSKPISCANVNSKTGVVKKIVYLYPVETLCSNVSLLPNAKSGILEHQGFKWEPIESILDSGLHSYLQRGVIEAYTIYRAHKAVNEALQKFR